MTTKEQALDGFPLDWRTRLALNELQKGVGPLPKGVASKTRDNLMERDWIERDGTRDYEPVYRLLDAGVTAMRIDDFARKIGWKVQRQIKVLRTIKYANLDERLKLLNSLNDEA